METIDSGYNPVLWLNSNEYKKVNTIIENYKKDLKEGKDVSKYLTQNYILLENLRKKRLDSFDVTIKEYDTKNTHRKNKDAIKRFDGKNKVCFVFDESIRHKEYYINNKKKLDIKDKNDKVYCLISTMGSSLEKVKCLNCGFEDSKENLMIGCPYCSTKFTTDASYDKINNIVDIITVDTVIRKITNFIPVVVIIYILFRLLTTHIYTVFSEMVGYGIVLFYIGGTIIGFYEANLKPYVKMNKVMKFNNDIVGKKIRDYDRYFSTEHFFSVIKHRLMIWVFAKNNDHISGMVNDSLSKDKNIIDLDIVKYSKFSFKALEDEIYIYVNVRIRYIFVGVKGIEKKYNEYTLTFVRDINVKTDLKSNLNVLKCSNCGSNINLLELESCKYCNVEIEFKYYDWVLKEVREIK